MISKTAAVEKIYLDSNVWFSYLLKKDDSKNSIEYQQANIIINKIVSDSNLIALISDLVILEIISIIRKKVATKMKITERNKEINDKDSKLLLKKIIDDLTKEFIDYITRWAAAGKLQIVKIDESLSNVLKREQKILKKNFGEIKKTTRCFVCKSEYHEYTYRGIDHYDIQHAIIAEYAKANQFITFDRSYESIKEDFPSLNIHILNSVK
jgi:hypothetical protein